MQDSIDDNLEMEMEMDKLIANVNDFFGSM
jgi:hypothetical protein